MLLNFILVTLGISAVLYVLFGGADYGAGVLEWMAGSRPDVREKIQSAMGPVWEANHVWLILIAVIAFSAFPSVYSTSCIYLHLPLVAMLLGVILRGTAFTFRHYDAVRDSSQEIYHRFFVLSSLWTPFWLGVIVASLTRGGIQTHGQNYFELYIRPWFGLYPFAVGAFTVSAFAFLAGTYLVGESAGEPLEEEFRRYARTTLAWTVGTGALVFLSAELDGYALISLFFKHRISTACFILATIGLGIFWRLLHSSSVNRLRLLAGAEVTFILVGWFALHFPNFMWVDGMGVSYLAVAAPVAVQKQLAIALSVGLLVIVPSFVFLFHVFKGETFRRR